MSPSGNRIFYGWWLLAASALIGLFAGGTFIYGITVIIKPVVSELGWSYEGISLSFYLTGLLGALLMPLLGGLVDRFGSRPLLIGAGLMTAAGFIVLSFADSITIFYIAFAIITVGGSAIGSVSIQPVLGNWFHRRMALAMGIFLSGVGLGALLVGPFNWLVMTLDWHRAALVVGIATAVVIPGLALLLRQSPEKYGWRPDGAAAPSAEAAEQGVDGIVVAPPSTGLTGRQALRTRTFWLLALVGSASFLAYNAEVIHIMPFLLSVDIDPAQAALVATFMPVLSVLGRLGSGWLGDRYPRRDIYIVAMFLQATGMGLLLLPPSGWSFALFVAVYGTGIGAGIVMAPAMMRERFGRGSFGLIQGCMLGATAVVGGVGPVLAGRIFDDTSSFAWAWAAFAVINLAGMACLLFIPRREGNGFA
jgi:MFS family permease